MSEQSKFNITYLLGAGASAYAVPTIKYFNILLYEFRNEVKAFLINNRFMFTDGDEERILDKLKLIDELTSFATIDTWARKMYLSHDESYDKLKDVLSLFLVYCQLGSTNTISHVFGDQQKMISNNLFFNDIEKNQFNRMFQTKLDPRYDLFLGSILNFTNDKMNVTFPDNINILSWNYDSQLETSLRTFSKNKILKLNGDSINYLKINSTANFKKRIGSNTGTTFHFDPKGIYNKDNWGSIISILNNKRGHTIQYENELKFAWEMEDNVIQEANKIILNTDILVVIGYTFPSFNQTVERAIFKGGNIKKVYYQIPQGEYLGLVDRLKGMINNDLNRPEPMFVHKSDRSEPPNDEAQWDKVIIENINDLSQFYIPNEFYL